MDNPITLLKGIIFIFLIFIENILFLNSIKKFCSIKTKMSFHLFQFKTELKNDIIIRWREKNFS